MAQTTSRPFSFKNMSKASKLVSTAIIGGDYKLIYIGGKAYPVPPPTIKRMAGAISCISDLDLGENGTIKEMFLSCKDAEAYSKALSWLVKGDLSLSEEFTDNTLEEVIEGLSIAFDMVGVVPFLKAASLTRSASLLAASPK